MAILVSDSDHREFARRLQQYEQKKAALLEQFKSKQSLGDRVSLQKNTTNLFRHRADRKNCIDVRDFHQVIRVDPVARVAEIEGMTTYEDIVFETLKFGCLPTVVPELKTITIGGALSGVGIESSSFRYGLVHETVLAFDVLLGDGKVVTVSPDNEYRDLFYAFPNAYGTLGYALKVTVMLIPVKKYIKLQYYLLNDATEFFARMKQVCEANHREGSIAYVDGVVFSPDKMVLCEGTFIDNPPYTSNYQYMHVYYQSLLKRDLDYLRVEDYIWRWDSDWFWCSKYFYMQVKWLRALFGKWMLKSRVYRKIMHLTKHHAFFRWLSETLNRQPTESIIQDLTVPYDHAVEFLDILNKQIAIKPVWVCPVMNYQEATFSIFNMDPQQFYINFGIWGMVPLHDCEGYYNRLLEQEIIRLKGVKSLYSNAYYTEDEFWSIYDKSLYQGLKAKYDPNQLLGDLYNKCTERY